MNESKKELRNYFENLCLFVIGIFALILPLFFISTTTDAFVLPKQIALAGTIAVFFILFGLKTIVEGKLKFRSSPFDIPVFLFLVIVFLSAFLSSNRYDALIAAFPFLFMTFLYFGIVNLVKKTKQLLFILASLCLGTVLTSILTIFSFFSIYLLPFSYTHTSAFTPLGSLLDQALYFAFILPIAGTFAYRFLTGYRSARATISPFEGAHAERGTKYASSFNIFFTLAFIIITVGFGFTVYMLLTTQKPYILPFEIGLQTGFGAISQDTGNVVKSFLLGSGIGTYLNDFSRFKPAAYNQYANLWAFTFFRSSTFILELLATTGLLGIAAFFFLIFKVVKEKHFFLPLIFALIAAFILPFSFTPTVLLFILLAIFAVMRIGENQEKYPELEFYFVALKRKVFHEGAQEENPTQKRYGRFLAIVVSILLFLVIGLPIFFVTRFLLSDVAFQKSLVAASQNQGLQTYNLQIEAIKLFPYRDVYYRGFSQTNLALANALATQQAKDKPNQQAQQNIVTLIQQSITAGRNATTIAPLTSFNWNNLSAIYRSLIGFGQNADKFTILTSQQAIALDPTNPQQYVDLGGIYYQLGSYDDAIGQFKIAINFKNDYANAYYNIGHALESKGNLQDALSAYEIVRKLVENDATNRTKIDGEIATVKSKIASQNQSQNPGTQATNVQPAAEQQPLTVNKPTTTLPERNPQVKIPAPTVSVTAAPSPTAAVTPAP